MGWALRVQRAICNNEMAKKVNFMFSFPRRILFFENVKALLSTNRECRELYEFLLKARLLVARASSLHVAVSESMTRGRPAWTVDSAFIGPL